MIGYTVLYAAGARTGPKAELMKPSVLNLAVEDMLVLAAYTASLVP